MSDDFLDRATRALKDTGAPPPSDVARTRLRVMEDVRTDRKKRARVFYVAFPIAAVLACATAWAAQTGRLSAWVRGLKGESPLAQQTQPQSHPQSQTHPQPQTQTPAPEPAPAPAPELAPAPEPAPAPAPAPSATSLSLSHPSPSPSPSPSPISLSKTPSAAPTAEPPEEDAGSQALTEYKHAHKLHFAEQNYVQALPAWDTYLQDFPTGAFAVEARYNRAICLVKLGRKAEAKTALQPFADGKVAGGYRQDQAKALLEALDGNSP